MEYEYKDEQRITNIMREKGVTDIKVIKELYRAFESLDILKKAKDKLFY